MWRHNFPQPDGEDIAIKIQNSGTTNFIPTDVFPPTTQMYLFAQTTQFINFCNV